MPTSGRLARGFVWLVGGRIANSLLSLVSTAILARLLMPRDFGVISAAWVVLALANVLFDGAFGINLLRKTDQRPADVRTTLTLGIGLSLIVAALVIAISSPVETFFHIPHLGLVLAISSAVIPFKAIYAIATAQLQRSGKFGTIAASTIVGQFLGNILCGIPLGLWGAGVWSLVVALIVAGAGEAALAAISARLPFKPMLDRQAASEVLGSSFFSVANIMNWVANTGANALVGRFMGASDLGLYSRGWKLLDLIVAATATPLTRVLMPSFAKMQHDQARLQRNFLEVLWIVLPGYAVASAILTLQAPLVVLLALGPRWGDTIPVAQIMFATLLPRCVFKIPETFAVALGRSASTAVRQTIYAVLMITGTLIGVHHGITGVASAVSIAITLFYLISLQYAAWIGGIKFASLLNIHARSFILAACVGGVDFLALRTFGHFGIYVAHVAASALGGLSAVVIIALAPRFWLGPKHSAKLSDILSSIKHRRSGRLAV
jgi:O-antigen/teichoic acid export membrane protein